MPELDIFHLPPFKFTPHPFHPYSGPREAHWHGLYQLGSLVIWLFFGFNKVDRQLEIEGRRREGRECLFPLLSPHWTCLCHPSIRDLCPYQTVLFIELLSLRSYNHLLLLVKSYCIMSYDFSKPVLLNLGCTLESSGESLKNSSLMPDCPLDQCCPSEI